jgi:hypothetical protein
MDIAHLHFLVAEADSTAARALVEMLGQPRRQPRHRRARRPHGAAHLPGRLHAARHVAIIDLALPGMDGLELIRSLAALNSGSPDRHRRPAGQPAVLGRDPGPGLRHRPAGHHRQAGHRRQAESPARQLRRRRVRRVDATPRFTFAEDRRRPAAAPVRALLPAQDRAGHRPGQGPGSLRALAPSGTRRAGPGAFIDALEQNNRIDFLDWSMIELSVERCRWFHDQGTPISISINLAPETLAHPPSCARWAPASAPRA